MTALAYYLLKVMVCSGILFIYYHLALRNKLFHQWNRFYLLSVVLLSLTIPLMQFTFLHEEVGSTMHLLTIVQSADNYMEEIYIRNRQPLSAEQWIEIGYTIISIILFVSLFFSFFKINSIIRRHKVKRVDTTIKFISTEEKGTPFSFFRYIFWNEKIDINSETGRQIFQHELVHVKEVHSLDKVFMQLTLILFWCNPFFWLIRRELHLVHEFIADKKAVQQQDTAALAAMILQSAFPHRFSPVTNQFFQSPIKRRLLMLTKIQDPRLNYASRILALPLIGIVVLIFSFRTKSSGETAVSQKISDLANIVSDTLPQKNSKEINKIDVDKQKDRITVTYQDGSTDTLTVEEARQKQLILQKANKTQSKNETIQSQNNEQFQISNVKNKPIYFLDGKEFKGDLNKIDPRNIESINVLKDKSAVAKYGEKGKNGVVEIFTKRGNAISDTIPKNEPVFEKAEVAVSVDIKAWRKFLEMNLQSIIENAASKGMPPGQYTVNIRFIIKKDGNITDFKALNDPGYGLVQKVLEIIPGSPKWKPAEQNGKPVNSYHTQPITFVISDGNDSKEKNNPANTHPDN